MSRLVSALVLSLLAGCASFPFESPTYFRSRAADVMDVFPASIGFGYGFGGSFKATAIFHGGVSVYPTHSRRYGYDDRLFYGAWSEMSAGMPWSFWVDEYYQLPAALPLGEEGFADRGVPLLYRWQSFRDAPSGEGSGDLYSEPVLRQWGRHPSVARETTGAFGLPAIRRRIDYIDLNRLQGDPDPLTSAGAPNRATLWEARRGGRRLPISWGEFEVDIFAGFFGARIGFRPLEFVDLFLGLGGVDIVGDDLPVPGVLEASSND